MLFRQACPALRQASVLLSRVETASLRTIATPLYYSVISRLLLRLYYLVDIIQLAKEHARIMFSPVSLGPLQPAAGKPVMATCVCVIATLEEED